LIFHPLRREQIGRIVQFQIKRLADQLLQQGISLDVTPKALAAIANEGYDPTYGARPLKRVVQQRIQNPLATELLRGGIREGSGVRVDHHEDGFTFEPFSPTRATVEPRSPGSE
jgi:ATP-dependent Clp protease ATP-binding subunit ClpB